MNYLPYIGSKTASIRTTTSLTRTPCFSRTTQGQNQELTTLKVLRNELTQHQLYTLKLLGSIVDNRSSKILE